MDQSGTLQDYADAAVARDWSAYLVEAPAPDHPQAMRLDAVLEGITCTACIGDVERGLGRQPGILKARLNYATRRVGVQFDPSASTPERILAALEKLGFPGQPVDPSEVGTANSGETRFLLKCLGVAGFGMMNVMLLSVSVWSGNVTDMTPETRDFFHWLSALVALPSIAYAARPFFRSATRAIRALRMNMDVPISLGILLATGLSIAMTLTHGHLAYFDSALMLLFFLLLGRYLDESMRRRTHVEAARLAALNAETAARIGADGQVVEVPASRIAPGEQVLVRPGDRIAVDGVICEGKSQVDCSFVTGETRLQPVHPGDFVRAGSVNDSGVLVVKATAAARDSLLAEIGRLLDAAAEARSRYLRLSDRAARSYSPVVHTTALLTFLGWMLLGSGWDHALVIAISVLIITCPCALALAIPAVQVVTAGVMFRHGILLAAGDAIERLAEVDTILFDKTGTLTQPSPSLVNGADIPRDVLDAAGYLAAASRHPLGKVLARLSGHDVPPEGAYEIPGEGVEVEINGLRHRLGSAAFTGVSERQLETFAQMHPDASLIAYQAGESEPVLFAIAQGLRSDALETVRNLKASGYRIEILSGDREAAVERIARALGIETFHGGFDPRDKTDYVGRLKAQGHRTLMIGDGLNDAPALAAAHVSLSPASATRLARNAADAVFLGERLEAVPRALLLARRARRAMHQNLGAAVFYNLFAVPLAVMGYVTPLVAALAMSGSSVIVTLNALRLRHGAIPDATQDRDNGAGLSRTALPAE